jgi:hypothetical protein
MARSEMIGNNLGHKNIGKLNYVGFMATILTAVHSQVNSVVLRMEWRN